MIITMSCKIHSVNLICAMEIRPRPQKSLKLCIPEPFPQSPWGWGLGTWELEIASKGQGTRLGTRLPLHVPRILPEWTVVLRLGIQCLDFCQLLGSVQLNRSLRHCRDQLTQSGGPALARQTTINLSSLNKSQKSLLLVFHSILCNLRAEGLIDDNTVVVILCQDMSSSPGPLFGDLLHVRLCLPLSSLTARCR